MLPMSRQPDPRANGLSTNDYCALLPRQRYTHEARSRILLLPSTGLVVVPLASVDDGGWYVAVVEGNDTYPVDGHDLFISKNEIETAIELAVGEPKPTIIVNNTDEAEALDEGTYILTRAHDGLRKTTVDGEVRWTRTILKKVSLRTDELLDEFPVVVSGGRVAKEPANV